MKLVLALLLALSLHAQIKITLNPRDYKNGAVWVAVVCAPPTTASSTVSAGRLYQIMVEHGYGHDTYAQAMADIDKKVGHSTAARVAKYAGYAAAAAAFMTSTAIIKTNQSWSAGLTVASGALNQLIPLAQAAAAALPAQQIKASIIRDEDVLRVPPGMCTTGSLIGTRGQRFEVIE